MRAVIVAYGEDATLALREAQDVSNILQAGGYAVHLLTGEDATLDCMTEALSSGPFDLAWLIMHSGAEGFRLADQVVQPAQLGQWLAACHSFEAVLNSCFSAEHVAAIQYAAHVDVVATIDPSGVDGRVAHSTGVYLARALVDTGDLQDACSQASGNGAIQYRWFPAASGLRQVRSHDDGLARRVDDLVVALTGNLSGQRGLIARMDELSADLKQYVAANEAWHREHETRLQAVERRRGLFGLPFWLLAVCVGVLLPLAARAQEQPAEPYHCWITPMPDGFTQVCRLAPTATASSTPTPTATSTQTPTATPTPTTMPDTGIIFWREAFGGNQEAYVTLPAVAWQGADSSIALLLLSQSSDAPTVGTLAAAWLPDREAVQLLQLRDGGWSEIGDHAHAALGPGGQFGARVVGDTLTAYVNGSQVARVIVAWPAGRPAGGYIGLVASEMQGTALDDFGGGTLP